MNELKKGTYEYAMSETLAKELLKDRKGDEKKMENQTFLCNYVNTQYGLMGECVGVKLS